MRYKTTTPFRFLGDDVVARHEFLKERRNVTVRRDSGNQAKSDKKQYDMVRAAEIATMLAKFDADRDTFPLYYLNTPRSVSIHTIASCGKMSLNASQVVATTYTKRPLALTACGNCSAKVLFVHADGEAGSGAESDTEADDE